LTQRVLALLTSRGIRRHGRAKWSLGVLEKAKVLLYSVHRVVTRNVRVMEDGKE